MNALRNVALGALLILSAGCTLTLDPESVDPPAENPPPPPPPPPVTPRGACIEGPTGKQLCGGSVSGGAVEIAATRQIVRGKVGTPAPNVSNAQHQIVRGDVSP